MAGSGLCQSGKHLLNIRIVKPDRKITELSLNTPNGTFGGLHWPNEGAPRVLCLHGWLDNAASFVPLANFLQDYDLIALDLAGHGHSFHRPDGARYYMMDNLWDIDAALDALQWPDCTLIGHSLGGVIASTYSVAAPERVNKLITLDGLGPLSASPDKTAERLRASLQSIRKAGSGLKAYADIESAARVRQKATAIPFELALPICERSLSLSDGFYRWSTDPSLKWRSPSLLTEEQVLDILGAIKAQTLSITCDTIEKLVGSGSIEKRRSVVQDFTFHRLQGHHHFHMDQAETVARLIIEFLNR